MNKIRAVYYKLKMHPPSPPWVNNKEKPFEYGYQVPPFKYMKEVIVYNGCHTPPSCKG